MLIGSPHDLTLSVLQNAELLSATSKQPEIALRLSDLYDNFNLKSQGSQLLKLHQSSYE